jgi:hypothetical protein
MGTHDLDDLLHARPFRPFRIHVSDGTTFDIHHPDLVVPGITSVFVGIPPSQQPTPRYYEHFEIVFLGHITRLEPLEPAARPA